MITLFPLFLVEFPPVPSRVIGIWLLFPAFFVLQSAICTNVTVPMEIQNNRER